MSQNEKLTYTLREARDHIAALREEVEKLTQPPSAYGTFLERNADGTVDVFSSGRKMRVALHPEIETDDLQRGQEVVLNESLNVVLARSTDNTGELVTLKELLDDGKRAVIIGRADEERVVEMVDELQGRPLRSGTSLLLDPRADLLLEELPRPEVEELVLEEVPDVSYEDGRRPGQPDRADHRRRRAPVPAPGSVPRTRPARPEGHPALRPALAAARPSSPRPWPTPWPRRFPRSPATDEARSYFYNIKGPELLNKYVGETERQIRLVFQRAREKSEEGWPVIVFFDEMESLFRTRGSGISSDMESTVVPQLLAEIDGVETLKNVIVIGASNREDLIDPAILRPGRLDVKIKIEPTRTRIAAASIFGRYLTDRRPDRPSQAIDDLGGGDIDKAVRVMIEQTVTEMYLDDERNEFLEVTYQNGDKETMFFKDFSSGAMIENIVRRAKKLAIKRVIDGGPKGIRLEDLIDSIRQEYREHEDLPNTTNPDDWAKISGKKGERIVFIRTLVHGNDDNEGGRCIERVATGQYL